jgi:hypothetical protein
MMTPSYASAAASTGKAAQIMTTVSMGKLGTIKKSLRMRWKSILELKK